MADKKYSVHHATNVVEMKQSNLLNEGWPLKDVVDRWHHYKTQQQKSWLFV